MSNLLRLRAESMTIEVLLREAMIEARTRLGMTHEQFASLINDHSCRNLGLIGPTIKAYEDGRVPPPGDILLHAVQLAGLDLHRLLTDWLWGLNRPSSSPPPPSRPYVARASDADPR